LDYANKYDVPRWFVGYNWKQYFNMKNFSPATLFNLSKQILNTKEACLKFKDMRFVGGPGITVFESKEKDEPCGEKERK